MVFGQKILSKEEYQEFEEELRKAKVSVEFRDQKVNEVVEKLEKNLQLLGLTGVEDKLQEDVKGTLESIRNAGIKVWMLTGDKIETATCIARSAKLVSRNQEIFSIVSHDSNQIFNFLCEFSEKRNSVLIIDGSTLKICLDDFPEKFILSGQFPIFFFFFLYFF